VFTKHLSLPLTCALALSLPLFSACAPNEVQPSGQVHQGVGVWIPVNSAQAFGLEIDRQTLRGLFYSTTPPTGTAPSPTGWWLRSTSTDYYAPISSISFGGQNVTDLQTLQGWLQVTTPSSETLTTVNSGTALYLTIGAPMNKVLRITHSSSEATYGKYTAEWSEVAGGGWHNACPHEYIDERRQTINLSEYMIPVGNALWHIDGSKTTPAKTIQLSCTHDSVGGCITWGYLPWDAAMTSTHQACTRLKRGDFCGTGDAGTTINAGAFAHTQIQVWDTFYLHESTGQTLSTMEAYWDEDGAVCFNRDRYRSLEEQANLRLDEMLAGDGCQPIPTCDKGGVGLLGSGRVLTSGGSGSGGSTL